jgi:hypothetical protein
VSPLPRKFSSGVLDPKGTEPVTRLFNLHVSRQLIAFRTLTR